MPYIKLIFGIILLFAGIRGKSQDDQIRLQGVAEDTWNAVTSAQEAPISGPAGHAASSLVLVAIAGHESGFWSKVQDCSACWRGSPFCDKGLSVTLYQMREGSGAWGPFSREQLCSDNYLATTRALELVNRHRKASTTFGLFRGYAHGSRFGADREMHAMFGLALIRAGITVTYRDGALHAGWNKGREPVDDQD